MIFEFLRITYENSVLRVCVGRYRMGKTVNLIMHVSLLVESYMTQNEE